MKKVGIAFLGFGTVGEEVFRLLEKSHYVGEDNIDIQFEVRAIFVRDVLKKRNVDVSGIYITSNYLDIINNPDIHICIECMGGVAANKTVEIIEAAIRKGKHIIMSSKKCFAQNMSHIIGLANYYNVQLRFEATVGGAIPICHSLMSMSSKNEINRMYGVINATTNYVLSLMEQYHMDIDKALEIAKNKGFTENDSSEDIDGWDAAYKMKILAGVGMKVELNCDEIDPVTMNLFEHRDSDRITSVRQIFYLEKKENRIAYYVGPVELEKDNIMYNVRDNYNIIFVDSKGSGVRAYYGKGAGGKETASIMYEDLLDIFKHCYWLNLSKTAVCEKISAKEINI